MKRRSAASAGGGTRSRGTPCSSAFADTVRPQGHASQRFWHGVVPSDVHGSETPTGGCESAGAKPGTGPVLVVNDLDGGVQAGKLAAGNEGQFGADHDPWTVQMDETETCQSTLGPG